MPGQKGNSGGKKGRSGRKSKAEELGVVNLFEESFSYEERRLVIQNLSAIAQQGKDPKAAVSAATFLFGYLYGKPRESVEHSGPSGNPFEVIVRHVTGATEAAD